MGLEFWVYLPQMRMSFPTILERARAAEAAGFDGVALMDHLGGSKGNRGEMTRPVRDQ